MAGICQGVRFARAGAGWGELTVQNLPLLSLTTFLPLVGAGFILITRGEAEVVAHNAR